jgi:PAS domain S-box-containing protein
MIEGFQIKRKIPWFNYSAHVSELEEFLDSLPLAGLLVDSQSWSVLHANPQFLELSNYTRSELAGLNARTLFASAVEAAPRLEIAGDQTAPTQGQAAVTRLIRRDQTQAVIRLHTSAVKGHEEKTLLVLEPMEALPDSYDLVNGSPFWEGVLKLFGAETEPDLQAAISQAFSAAAALSGADLLVVYRLMEGSPQIARLSSYGEDHMLPDTLSMEDLVALNQVRLWETGKHPSCSLYRTARTAGIRYLASAPVGGKTAVVGLVLIASTRSSPPDTILQIVHLLAVVIESVFQNHIQRANLSSDLYNQAFQARRLATITERVHEGVMQLSPELVIRSINPRLEQYLGYSSREVSGHPAEKILIGDDALYPGLVQAQGGEASFTLGDVRLFRRNGEPFQAYVRIYPVIQDRRVDEILVFIQDLSERELIRIQTQELENRALLGELLTVFAHEVRNPINNISTGLQVMALNLSSDPAQQDSVARMLQDFDRLTALVRSLLAVSKPVEYQMKSLDIGLLVQRLLDRLRPRISNPKIVSDLQVEPGVPPVSGDFRALEQVFTNLIDNAVQAMGEKGGLLSLKVQSTPTNQGSAYVSVFVADTGPGIPKENQERIFEPFFTTKPNGTGVGLSISRRIVTAHKGIIQLTSFPGGTVFQVQLPVSETDPREE